MSDKVDLANARANLGKLADRAAGGETIDLTRRGATIARLVPPDKIALADSGEKKARGQDRDIPFPLPTIPIPIPGGDPRASAGDYPPTPDERKVQIPRDSQPLKGRAQKWAERQPEAAARDKLLNAMNRPKA